MLIYYLDKFYEMLKSEIQLTSNPLLILSMEDFLNYKLKICCLKIFLQVIVKWAKKIDKRVWIISEETWKKSQ